MDSDSPRVEGVFLGQGFKDSLILGSLRKGVYDPSQATRRMMQRPPDTGRRVLDPEFLSEAQKKAISPLWVSKPTFGALPNPPKPK